MELDKSKEQFVNKYCLGQKIVYIEWESIAEAYRCMLENGVFILIREIY